jgi:hypothetical protein
VVVVVLAKLWSTFLRTEGPVNTRAGAAVSRRMRFLQRKTHVYAVSLGFKAQTQHA